jgi:hypothetical protein
LVAENVDLREPGESTVDANARTTDARRSARTLLDLAICLVRPITTKGLPGSHDPAIQTRAAVRIVVRGSPVLLVITGSCTCVDRYSHA